MISHILIDAFSFMKRLPNLHFVNKYSINIFLKNLKQNFYQGQHP